MTSTRTHPYDAQVQVPAGVEHVSEWERDEPTPRRYISAENHGVEGHDRGSVFGILARPPSQASPLRAFGLLLGTARPLPPVHPARGTCLFSSHSPGPPNVPAPTAGRAATKVPSR
jgi:hypothetical protein